LKGNGASATPDRLHGRLTQKARRKEGESGFFFSCRYLSQRVHLEYKRILAKITPFRHPQPGKMRAQAACCGPWWFSLRQYPENLLLIMRGVISNKGAEVQTEPPLHEERMRLILILAILAGLTVFAGHALAPATAMPAGHTGLSVVVDAEGSVRASGQVPRDFPLKDLSKHIPGIDLSGGVVNLGEGDPQNGAPQKGVAEDWERVLDMLTIVIPRLRRGEAWITGRRIGISGTLQPGFSAEATRGAIRLAAGSAWEVEIELSEAPPPAAIILRKTARGVAISGILPAGIEPPEALLLLGVPPGDAPHDDGLTGGGQGDATAWGATLASLGKVVPLYADAAGRVSNGIVEIEGTLLPGYEAGGLVGWLMQQLGEDWQVRLEGREIPARDGDTRRDLATGEITRLRSGRWLPEFDFEPGPQSCANQTIAVLSGGGVIFVTGKSQVDHEAQPILDRLAGIALRCLNQGGLTLRIGGHTDNIGDDASNSALSQKRAMAVLLELMDRGVRTDAMSAIGYGETRPIADNGSPEGQAKNRRITFDWSR
jgi:OOP family OmpA-OmpF porin